MKTINDVFNEMDLDLDNDDLKDEEVEYEKYLFIQNIGRFTTRYNAEVIYEIPKK